MQCKSCYKYFERGTTNSSAPYNICDKCYNAYFQIQTTPLSKDQEVQNCIEIIQICSNNIKHFREKIDEEIDTMKHWCEQLNQLTMEE